MHVQSTCVCVVLVGKPIEMHNLVGGYLIRHPRPFWIAFKKVSSKLYYVPLCS